MLGQSRMESIRTRFRENQSVGSIVGEDIDIMVILLRNKSTLKITILSRIGNVELQLSSLFRFSLENISFSAYSIENMTKYSL
jgi:hypothetical protein